MNTYNMPFSEYPREASTVFIPFEREGSGSERLNYRLRVDAVRSEARIQTQAVRFQKPRPVHDTPTKKTTIFQLRH